MLHRHPDQIDNAILAAINITLCLASNGDGRVAEGFNSDILTTVSVGTCH